MVTEKQKEEIYRAYHGKISGYIGSKINSAQDAEDLTADIFAKILEKLDTFGDVHDRSVNTTDEKKTEK